MSLKIIHKGLYSAFLSILLIMATGCSDDAASLSVDSFGSPDDLSVTGSLLIPDIVPLGSRGDFGEMPAENLKLTVIEFDKGENAADSFLSNIYEATITGATQDESGSGVIVSYSLTLKAAGTSKMLHFMVADSYFTPGFGSEASVLPGIYVGCLKDDYWSYTTKEAYWGKIVCEDGFNTIDENGNAIIRPDVEASLQNVPLIRNFAKLTVEVPELKNFRFLGFDIVNIPTAGTVAPWDQEELKVPELLKEGTAEMKDYSTIGYKGIMPGVAQFVNTEVEAKSWNASSTNMNNVLDGTGTASRYIYEHPYESTRRSYIIVHGKYCSNPEGSENPEDWKDGFYKLDLKPAGESESNYNIIRNIHYTVRIHSINTEGSPTVENAVTSAPLNNVSASVETAGMLNVSDGKNILFVNATTHIIINDEPITVLYRYQNLKGTAGDPRPFNLVQGSVINSWTGPESFIENEDNPAMRVEWMKIVIQPNEPDAITQTQSFSIIDGLGLGRTINLVLRKPWQYAKIGDTDHTATIAPGIKSLYTYAEPQIVSAFIGKTVTVYFNLPDGLPESIFPLEFQLQAKNQALENNKIDNMVVHTGESLFNPAATAISYLKTVTYQEYRYNYISDESNDVNVNSQNTNHTIRCRFLTTIYDVSDDCEVIIHNKYFTPDASVKFKRSTSVNN